MSKQNKIILIIAVALIAVGLILAANKNKQAPQDNNSNNNQAVKPIEAADHVFGDIKSPVQIIIYSDFECPFCAEFADTMKKIEGYFIGKAVIAFRHYPLPSHAQAVKAAQASECAAEQGKFWPMHDLLFADNVAGRLSAEQFKKDAADLGLDQDQFNQCLASGKYKDKIAEQKAAGDKAGVTGTPTIFVNGNIYPGAYPFEDFTSPDGRQNKGMKSIIEELLK